MDPERRWKLVLDNHLCRTCLGKHGRRPCKLQSTCGVESCRMRHHPLLHAALYKQDKTAREESKLAGAATENIEKVNAHHNPKQSVLFKFLPVRLFWKERSVETFAFLDDRSNVTLVEDWVAKRLGIDDDEDLPLCMSWTGNVTRYEPNSQRVSLEIGGASLSARFMLNDTRTVKNLGLPRQSLNFGELAQQHSHLKGIPLNSYESVSPGILIGSNNASLIAALKLKEGQLSDPIACKTRLGWTLSGMAEEGDSSVKVSLHICARSQDSELHDLVKEFFSVDSVGVSVEKGPESDDDKRARSILERTTRRVSNQFETGLMWRYDQFKFPNSFGMAKRRLECFERRMKADPELRESVQRQIIEYLQSGYIHLATAAELKSADPGRVWYLPLGAVRNPKKPGKIRLVWDAAAKVQGVSFNSMLLKGSDLLTSLLEVLFGFRERKVAICGDLKQMFHQFRILPCDVHSQRFLYRKDPSHAIQVYVMDVGTFGSTSSPSQAQFIKNLNAEDHKNEFPRAAAAIVSKHYVDDYLDSFDSVDEAIKVALEVKQVHANGGFMIRNWLSNSEEVLRRVGDPGPDEAKLIEINKEKAVERVLGMSWIPKDDQFMYDVDLNVNGITPTKRNLLRCVMSIFDPLGLLSHFLVHGRIIIQDIWRTQAGWDEGVSGEIKEKSRRWIAGFEELSRMRIDRAYFPGFSSAEIGPLQLHVFTDASEDAYACVAYLRAEINGNIHCALVMSKAKVAPLKVLSIPRLELQGAVLGARVAKTIIASHSLSIVRRVLWTDSETVLAWIKSDHRRYRQFVACRIGEILDKTNGEDWNWIPSKQNVADEATKWGKGPCFGPNSRWVRGPEFLRRPEAEWPKKTTAQPLETTEELRACLIHREVVVEHLVDFRRFSKWERLLRTIAYVVRCFDNARRRRLGKPKEIGRLLRDELQRSESVLWRMVQAEVYPDEVAVLLSGSPVRKIDKTSKIYKLSPFADERSVLRVDSRIGAATSVTYDFKFPIILPRYHRLTELLVDWYHRKFRHANNETIVNEIRQRFQIPNLRTVIRQVTKNCQSCKIRKASPVTPKMGPLPAARLEQCSRPFTYVGIDYFGPISVKRSRSLVKRWVALFTCLTVRAIHLEIVHSLTTESCKMAIRRFIAYRGAPSEIYTDNGTNFKGASRELLQELKTINNGLANTFTDANTKWVFNPPSAPHFGGVWERLVRSVKVAMASLPAYGNPDDETLQTIMAEISAVINSRPLTFIPLQSTEQEVLTPNHFIHLSSDGVVRTRKPLSECHGVCRTNWDMSRLMVDQFWKRWTKEYLPTISMRTKWFDETKAPQIGDLVVLVEKNVRNGWIRGRIISVVTGRDGRVRQAVVQTNDGVFRRPVCKIAVLDVLSKGKTEQLYESGSVTDTGSTAVSVPRSLSNPSITDNLASRQSNQHCHFQQNHHGTVETSFLKTKTTPGKKALHWWSEDIKGEVKKRRNFLRASKRLRIGDLMKEAAMNRAHTPILQVDGIILSNPADTSNALGEYFTGLSSISGYEPEFIRRQGADITSVSNFVVSVSLPNNPLNWNFPSPYVPPKRKLLDEAAKRQGSISSSALKVIHDGKEKKQIVCHYCKNLEHKQSEGRKLVRDSEKGSKTAEKPSNRKESVSFALAAGLVIVSSRTKPWIVDSDATRHTVADQKFFRELRESEVKFVNLADGKQAVVRAEPVFVGKLR
ncbi:uncharacterized protein LOC129761395 [Toxorhynchites rutilus septentrionalis]|uniref:uncharacterized protein LOC129761395 n=1 Tax=Toxorhynchites rutilus septentrionalis TaxID=329112 RepID=UPI00247957C6|nr:uncharacterized protein LOC129761395 [Toxorhynchites rutilus septentrionalis]